MRLDPCPLVGQVNEIPELESADHFEWDPCHLAWQVNKIFLAVEEYARLKAT
jgi:hypothetical protein